MHILGVKSHDLLPEDSRPKSTERVRPGPNPEDGCLTSVGRKRKNSIFHVNFGFREVFYKLDAQPGWGPQAVLLSPSAQC